MAAQQCLPVLCVILVVAFAEPTPGRVPKVYNALITSNQNLEPSKAFPLYQPVLHNTFPFPLQTVVYGDLPLANGFLPVPASLPKDTNIKPEQTPSSTPEAPVVAEASEQPTQAPEPSSPAPEDDKATQAPPLAPKTESPVPLNEFGLPPQVLPLGRINPAYQFTHLPTYPYAYPGLRFYDPYDPFGFHTYANWPLYQPLTNFIGQPLIPAYKAESPVVSSPAGDKSSSTPPPEPSDLNVLNYSNKDPAIPNVPPPPLPQGGLKADTE
ncbi:extensin [Vanessa atalanta]|uniref:extensin n=1 Tax=Vanessa atalanta TaxID=42275 RepID=UPI001FCD70DC|nr:extensin [Vanessa atalanta]